MKTQLKRLPRGNLFQTIRAEIAESMKIVVQTAPITEPSGVQAGRLMVLYQSIPPLVIKLPAKATRKTINGIII